MITFALVLYACNGSAWDRQERDKRLPPVESHMYNASQLKFTAILETAAQAPAFDGTAATATSPPNAHCLPPLKFPDNERHLCNFDLRRPAMQSHSST